ncbi:MAG: hypothetical protein KAH34_18070, partial [Ketobacter sp.]|nr:hypothetical protein [Ketobacter sp.]
SGLLGDTNASADDRAAHICPVGCILPKTGNYQEPIGTRLYDHHPIHDIGNLRKEERGGSS